MIKNVEKEVIVVPWSCVRASLASLEWALGIADSASQVHVVHIAAPLAGPDNGALLEAAERRKSVEIEADFRRQVGNDICLEGINFHVFFGHVGQEVVRFADREKAGMIVMMSGERKGLAKFLFEGLAERTVRTAHCPVLVLKGAANDARTSHVEPTEIGR